jgi:hypothetical protein
MISSSLFIYRKVLQPVAWPAGGSQLPMLNPKSGWNVIESDGKKYAISHAYIILGN